MIVLLLKAAVVTEVGDTIFVAFAEICDVFGRSSSCTGRKPGAIGGSHSCIQPLTHWGPGSQLHTSFVTVSPDIGS